MNEFEDLREMKKHADPFEKIIETEYGCRAYIDYLLSKDVSFSTDPRTLTFKEMQALLREFIKALAKEERH